MKIKTLFLSDIHLGNRHCLTRQLLSLLSNYQAETIYLVGDIIEFPTKSWKVEHRDVIYKLLWSKANIVYLPGNHDACLRIFNGFHYGSLLVCHSKIHETVLGKKFLVIHGDTFDKTLKYYWIAKIISKFYSIGPWSRKILTRWIMKVSDFERQLKIFAERSHADGVIVGHMHSPKITETYINLGDWLDNCTALIEHEDGRLELVKHEIYNPTTARRR